MKKLALLTLIVYCFLIPTFAQKSNFVETNGLKLHYLEYGKGFETLVLIHGLSDTAEIWKDFAPILAKKNRVIAIDRRGVGKSQKTESGYNLKTFAEDVRILLDELKLKKVHLVGHSFGGNIVMTFAANFPNRLKTLTLIEGGFWEKREKVPEIPKCPEPIETDCLITSQILSETYNYDPKPLFVEINKPTMFVMGVPNFEKLPINDTEKSRLKSEYQTIFKNIEETAKTNLKNGKLVTIDKAEHWVFNDQPGSLAINLLSFIKTKTYHYNSK